MSLEEKLAQLSKTLGREMATDSPPSYLELRKEHAQLAQQDTDIMQRDARMKRVNSLQGASDLNPKWRFDSLVIDEQDIAEAYEFSQSYIYAFGDPSFRDNPHMVIVYGDYGRGKSHLTGAIAHELIEQHEISVLYRQLQNLLQLRIYSHDFNSQDQVSQHFNVIENDLKNVDLLILDEVAVNESVLTQTAQIWLGTILRERFSNKKKCILITNHNLPELANALGPFCSESIREYDTHKLHFVGPSRREDFINS